MLEECLSGVRLRGQLKRSRLGSEIEVPSFFSHGVFLLLCPEQAPIQVFGLEGRYAHALFAASAKSKSLEKVEAELNEFQVSIHSCHRLTCILFMNK